MRTCNRYSAPIKPQPTIQTARVDGTYDYGNCGIVPLVRVSGPKPAFTNNGWNVYSGQPRLHVPGLRDALPDEGRPSRQGHVMIVYDDGGRFGTYTSTVRGDDTYDFS